MPGLRQVAGQLVDGPLGPDLPEPDVAAAADRVDAFGPGIDLARATASNAVAARIAHCLGQGRALSRADLRAAAWCLWTTSPALAEDDQLLAAYLRAIIRMDLRRPFRSLATSYLMEFRRNRPQFSLIARTLALSAAKAGLPWSAAQAEVGLFEPETLVRRVTDRAMQRGIRPARIFEDLRLGTLPRHAGVLHAIHAAGLERLRAAENRDPMQRLAALSIWARDDAGDLVADHLAPLVTDAMLAPFRGETPDRDVRDAYVQLMLELMGDPRLQADWRGRNPKNEAIVRRWLTEQSLRIFLDVVGRVVPPESWGHRRAFWESLYRASLVDDAWVVFEPDAAGVARQLFGQRTSLGAFSAEFEMGRGMAVLMLRIGALIVVDWSHAGPCLIWDTRRESGAPELYRQSYDPARLRKPATGPETLESHAAQGIFWHSGTTEFVWQDRIAAYLGAASGIRLPAAAYRL